MPSPRSPRLTSRVAIEQPADEAFTATAPRPSAEHPPPDAHSPSDPSRPLAIACASCAATGVNAAWRRDRLGRALCGRCSEQVRRRMNPRTVGSANGGASSTPIRVTAPSATSYHPYRQSSCSPRARLTQQLSQTSVTSPPPPPPSLARNKVRPIGPVMTKSERDALTLPPLRQLSLATTASAKPSSSLASTATTTGTPQTLVNSSPCSLATPPRLKVTTTAPSVASCVSELETKRRSLDAGRQWIIELLEDVSCGIKELDRAIERGRREREQ